MRRFFQRVRQHEWRKYFREPTAVPVKLVVAGAQKAGTTSLYNYLGEHPRIQLPVTKEVNYFNSIDTRPPNMTDYQANFPFTYDKNSNALSVDISPSYMLDSAIVANRIRSLDEEIKIVIVLRDPLARAQSAWFMYKRYYIEQPEWFMQASWVRQRPQPDRQIVRRTSGFGDCFSDDVRQEIDALEQGYRIEYPIVEYGHYYEQVSDFISKLGEDNVLILFSRSLDQALQETLNRITDFIGIERYHLPDAARTRHFVGVNKQPIDTAELKPLAEYYAHKNKGLESLIGQPLPWHSQA